MFTFGVPKTFLQMHNPGGREMKLTVVLAVLIGTLIVGCSSAAPAPVEPTPNSDATVEAKLAQERAVDATVEARLREKLTTSNRAVSSPKSGHDAHFQGWSATAEKNLRVIQSSGLSQFSA